MMTAAAGPAVGLHLLDLPAELIDSILSLLEPHELGNLTSTCKALRAHALNERLWHTFIQTNLDEPLTSHFPCSSYRELFLRHHPRWFLVKHRIWFADLPHHGRLILARYDQRRGCIEAYRLTTERGPCKHGSLEWDGNSVTYHSFKPKIGMDLNGPVLQLNIDESMPLQPIMTDISMDIRYTDRDRNRHEFIHTRPLPLEAVTPQTQVWPPLTLPSIKNQRTRCSSSSSFRSVGHGPTRLSELSDVTFRVRQWVEFSHFIPQHIQRLTRGGIVGEQVSTYATIPPECYMPTPEKPWQGIWVGDYSTHGCEFLLIVQPGPDSDWPPMPRKARKAFGLWPETDINFFTRNRPPFDNDETDEAEEDEDAMEEDESFVDHTPVAPTNATRVSSFLRNRRAFSTSLARSKAGQSETISSDTPPYSGPLYAIKLTGDPNVPRGEITFIAEELGADGFVCHTSGPLFRDESTTNSSLPEQKLGSRVVRSVGHIAGHAFRADAYIPSQLILASENRLAQYWKPFHQVSFYERIDLSNPLFRCQP